MKEILEALNKKTDFLSKLIGWNKESILRLERRTEDLDQRVRQLETLLTEKERELREIKDYYNYNLGE